MYTYTAYNLIIQSDLRFPELPTGAGPADVRIVLGDAIQSVPQMVAHRGYFFSGPGRVGIHTRAGLMSVREGREIVVSPNPDASEAVLRNFVITSAMNILLYQRGLFLLHASAIAIQDQAVAFIGEHGWGKSTLVAAFQAQGYRVIADDTFALDVESSVIPVAFPAFPQIKLKEDSHAVLFSGESASPTNPFFDKIMHRVDAANFASTSLPVRRIYVLDKGADNAIIPLNPQMAFKELFKHSYVGHFSYLLGINLAARTGESARHLRQCAKVANSVSVAVLARQWNLANLRELVRLIEHDLVLLEPGRIGETP